METRRIPQNETSPELTILQLYELGIASCRDRNREQARNVILALMDSLNFEYDEMANSFRDIYSFALERLRMEEYDQVGYILRELLNTWKKAFANNGKGS